jgi:probable rRNA maturation factor
MDMPKIARRSGMRGQRPRLELTIQIAAENGDIPARRLLRRWMAAALERNASVTLRFVDSDEGLALNRAYRQGRAATNVLSFVYDDDDGALRGDIVLCLPVLRREAAKQGKALDAHCAHLVVHGMLHLQGYDHTVSADAKRMEAREAAVLASLGFSDPYVAADPIRPNRRSR